MSNDVITSKGVMHWSESDKLFIVQRRGGDVMISLYSGEDRPDQATAEVAEQVRHL